MPLEPEELEVVRSCGVGLVLMLVLAAGCTGDPENGPSTLPTPTAPSATSSPSATPTEPVPAYLGQYSPTEREAYAQAVTARKRFADRQAAIYRQPRLTLQNRVFYQKNTTDWRQQWRDLKVFVKQDVIVRGRQRVRSVRPATISIGGDPNTVILRLCVEKQGLRVTQGGTPVPQPEGPPSFTRVVMVQQDGESRWRFDSSRATDLSC